MHTNTEIERKNNTKNGIDEIKVFELVTKNSAKFRELGKTQK